MSGAPRRSRRISARNSVPPEDAELDEMSELTPAHPTKRRTSTRTSSARESTSRTNSARRSRRKAAEPVEPEQLEELEDPEEPAEPARSDRRHSGFSIVVPTPTAARVRSTRTSRSTRSSLEHSEFRVEIPTPKHVTKSKPDKQKTTSRSMRSLLSNTDLTEGSMLSVRSSAGEEDFPRSIPSRRAQRLRDSVSSVTIPEVDEDEIKIEDEENSTFSKDEREVSPAPSEGSSTFQENTTDLANTQLMTEAKLHSEAHSEGSMVGDQAADPDSENEGESTTPLEPAPANNWNGANSNLHVEAANGLKLEDEKPASPEAVNEIPTIKFDGPVEESNGPVALPTPSKPKYESPLEIMQRAKALSAQAMQIKTKEEAPPQSRIVIRYLVLTNFKSYAGRQVVGPFDVSFSSVVGPNGSGKSNVIDSLLFVFGFRASKMRQGKLSGLIHKSEAFPDLDHCEVEVQFEEVLDRPEGGVDVIEGKSLTVSRKAFKNNSSKYYIDGKPSDYTTVTTLLREKGVDLDHKRFLILQGEVESIAQMKPKATGEHDDGLLEYLEDIIGTSKYKSAIEEASTEADALAETCAEKSGRVDHVARERDALEEKKAEVEAHLRVENELAEKQAALWQIWKHKGSERLKVGYEEAGRLESELKEERDRNAGRSNEVDAMEDQVKEMNRTCSETTARREIITKELNKVEKDLVKLQERHKFSKAKRNKAEKRKTEAEMAFTDAEQKTQQAADDIGRAEIEIEQLEQQVEQEEQVLDEMREGLKGQTEGLSAELAKKQHDLAPWLERIGSKQRQLDIAQNELNLEQESQQRNSDSARGAIERVKAWEESVAEKKSELKNSIAELQELRVNAKKMHDKVASLASNEEQHTSKTVQVRQKVLEAKSIADGARDGNKIIAGLSRLQERGQIQGFYGRLGSLGGIDARYDVAITTACPGLENLVVETAEVGQACVEYLRKSGLGRANFILLDKLPKRNMDPIQTPSGSERLFDLVRPREDKFKPAFYNVLQNTVVTGNLEAARKIAYGKDRWRVVTLDGQLIDRSGTMSGGGTRVARGGMGQQSRQSFAEASETLSKLETKLRTMEAELLEVSTARMEREERERAIVGRIAELEILTGRLEVEIVGLERQIAESRHSIGDDGSQIDSTQGGQDRMEDLAEQIEILRGELDDLKEQSKESQAAVDQLQEQIMAVGGVRLRAQRAKVDGLQDRIKAISDVLSNAKNERIRSSRRAEQQQKAAAEASRDIESAGADLSEIDEQREALAEQADGCRQKAEEISFELESQQSQLSELKALRDEKASERDSARKAELDLSSRLEEKQKSIADLERKVNSLDRKLSGLRLHKLDGSDIPRPRVRGKVRQGKKVRKVAKEEDEDGDVDMSGDVMDVDEEEGGEGGEADEGEEEEEEADEDNADEMNMDEPEEIGDGELPYPVFSPDELDSFDVETLAEEIAALSEEISKATVDLSALEEYRRRDAEYQARHAELVGVTAQRDAANRRVSELRQLRLEGFMAGFAVISGRLKDMYQMITMGGNAELELVDSLDPFSEGILFSVMPPKKSWKNIGNLSGGEKTLSSLALVFALHQYRPTPLYVMDEIDAALDFRNVSIVAAYIKERTRNAQFIVISLRNNMFELASRLVGVYKVNHMTRSVTVENRDYLKRGGAGAGQQQQRIKKEPERQPERQQSGVGAGAEVKQEAAQV